MITCTFKLHALNKILSFLQTVEQSNGPNIVAEMLIMELHATPTPYNLDKRVYLKNHTVPHSGESDREANTYQLHKLVPVKTVG